MRRYLLVALWPAGLAAIAAATVIAIRREPVSPAVAANEPPDSAVAKPSDAAAQVRREGTRGSDFIPAGEPGSAQSIATAAASEGDPGGQFEPAAARRDWVPGLIRLGAIGAAGGI